MAEELRRRNLLPIVFDFERSEARDFTETIKILAGMCLFVIADITNPKSAPLGLQATVPDYQIPFVPILQEGEGRLSMFDDLKKKPCGRNILLDKGEACMYFSRSLVFVRHLECPFEV